MFFLWWFWKNYSTRVIRLDQFALAKMGLVQSHTILKIENYMIVCAPYQMSMRKALLFVVLSKEEIPFFTKYVEKLAALKLTFQKSLVSASVLVTQYRSNSGLCNYSARTTNIEQNKSYIALLCMSLESSSKAAGGKSWTFFA